MTRNVRSHHYRRDGTIARSLRPPKAILLPFSTGTFARTSSGTYMTAARTLVTAGNNVLRIEDRGDGNGAHALFEGAATNLNRYRKPSDFSNKNAVVINSLAGTSLLDERTQDTVEFGQASPNHQIFDNPGLTYTAEAHTGSIWVKVLSGTNSSQNFARNLSNETGTILATDSPSDWEYKTATATFAGTEGLGQLVRDNAAETKTWIWDCHQLETGEYATSYIDVSGAQASRVADSLTFASGVYPVDLVSGIWEWDVFPYFSQAELAAGGVAVLASFGGANDVLQYDGDANAFEIVTSGTRRGITSALTFSRHQKLTLKQDWINRELTISGATTGNGTVSLSSSDEWPSNVTLRIGGEQGGANEESVRLSEPRAA